ncbi:cytochrome c oxidase subunit VIb-like [Triplophysa rosa]|uniref:Cytochrome c oxidase subunit VIb-like n=1 Tax=Triplophysa rosa TaxID=992332 RepID=A0A9W7WBU9_TRIRA|nr:cytochrome c oxidase subunit VIb-like [Triplophysa rosa]
MPKVLTQPRVNGTDESTSLSALFPGLRSGTHRWMRERSPARSEYLRLQSTSIRWTGSRVSVIFS